MTFNPVKSLVEGSSFSVPCGQCIGCRIARAREWAVRCTHEAQMHDKNSFVTLTYADEHLPQDGSISVREFQLFMKRLRKKMEPSKIRFFGCGEYGGTTFRPHYHALLFNFFPPDVQQHSINNRGSIQYTSEILNEVWPYGQSLIGSVTYQSAGYCARYAMKKLTGDRAPEHYLRPHPITGKLYQVQPEFAVQSRRPGIGSTWFEQYSTDAFPSDFIVVDGKRHPVPRYYSLKLEEKALAKIKRVRKRKSVKQKANNTAVRLQVREQVLSARLTQLKETL